MIGSVVGPPKAVEVLNNWGGHELKAVLSAKLGNSNDCIKKTGESFQVFEQQKRARWMFRDGRGRSCCGGSLRGGLTLGGDASEASAATNGLNRCI